MQTEKKKLTPMLEQFMAIKAKHPHKILLFRMGDFYETFFDDAVKASRLLGITLTSRDKKKEGSVPLAGFPHKALDTYLPKLIAAGEKIVIADQIEDPKTAVGLVKRAVVEIITPGSVMDTKLIDPEKFNFMTAVVKLPKYKLYGLATIDITTADFLTTEIKKDDLIAELHRLMPREIIIIDPSIEVYLQTEGIEATISQYEDVFFDARQAVDNVKTHFGVDSVEGLALQHKKAATVACGTILGYLGLLKSEVMAHINRIHFYDTSEHMHLDDTSVRNLELFRQMRDQSKSGTLIAVMDKTCTAMGARRLHEWIKRPLLDIEKINERQLKIMAMYEKIHLCEDLRNILKQIGDLSRILSKVGSQRVNPREVLMLASFLSFVPDVVNCLAAFKDIDLLVISKKIQDYGDICTYIEAHILENPPLNITEGGIICADCSQELDELRTISRTGKSYIAALEQKEKEKTGIPSLKIAYNKVFGYYLEVSKSYKEKVPDRYIRKQTLVNCERYISEELKEYEAKVLGAEERIKQIEYEIYSEIKEKLSQRVTEMQALVDILSEIDVLSCLAWLAYKNNYVRPTFNEENILLIEDGRHPVVEKLLQNELYIPNDVRMDNKSQFISLITGPNMGGKSTYLRQVGLIAIMAQIGSFVPAKKANLPIFDKIFTRVGAADHLAMGKSTFLVEMLETANILASASPRSLILLDEIGRGTSTFDGLSLAWSIVEYIHGNPLLQSKTLFATHYHELTELESVLEGVKNLHITVKAHNDDIIFLRKIEHGRADQSYGVQVAKLAGLPQAVIKRAKSILKTLEKIEFSPQGLLPQARAQLKHDAKESEQLLAFSEFADRADKDHELIEEIRNVDINRLSPIEALQYLADIQQKINGEE